MTARDAERAQEAVDKREVHLYERRYQEISESKQLKDVAIAVAEEFAMQSALDSDRLRAIAEQVLAPHTPQGTDRDQQTGDLLKRLNYLGYVWQPPGQATIHPGIPSLMDYTRSKPKPPKN